MAAATMNSSFRDTYHQNVKSYSQAWQDAIARATECLRSMPQLQQQLRYNHNHNSTNNTFDEQQQEASIIANKSLSYLMELEWILNKKNHKNRPPGQYPPPFPDENTTNHHDNHDETNHATSTPQKPNPGPNYSFSSNNPFAVIQYDDDDDEEEEDEEEENMDSLEDEAGDQPVLMMTTKMVTRRLLLYILTGQADLLAYQARGYRSQNQWKNGAECCQTAVLKVQSALLLADTEISRHLQKWEEEEEDPHPNEVIRSSQLAELMADGQAVHIAVVGLVRERNQFLKQAEMQEQRLLRTLQPQWKSRDSVKQKMGQRWYSNPAPKHDYAKIRRDAEAQLREIQWALEHVRPLDTEGLQFTSQELIAKLQQQQQQQPTQHTSTRYNGLRPLHLSRRVSWELYPDPVEFGWKFTGSNEISKVEFFEKEFEDDQIVKLDWYYTTGTVKTSLEHPQQGKTQLFASKNKITSEIYIQILLNPREHTGIRYHRRQQRPYSKFTPKG